VLLLGGDLQAIKKLNQEPYQNSYGERKGKSEPNRGRNCVRNI